MCLTGWHRAQHYVHGPILQVHTSRPCILMPLFGLRASQLSNGIFSRSKLEFDSCMATMHPYCRGRSEHLFYLHDFIVLKMASFN